jgi:hypothetical protein
MWQKENKPKNFRLGFRNDKTANQRLLILEKIDSLKNKRDDAEF